jgi:DNA-binding NtrC family response regulator
MATLRVHPPPKNAVGSESESGAPQKLSWELYGAYVRRCEAWGHQLGALLQERRALDLMAQDLVAAARSGGPNGEGDPAALPPLSELVESYERQLIRMALGACGGSQREAATALGLRPTTLNEKLKRFGLRTAPQRTKH